MPPFDEVISIVAIVLSVIAIVISFISLYYTHFYRPNSLIAFLYDYQFNKITSDQLDFDPQDEVWIELSLNLQLINNGKRNNVIPYMYIYIIVHELDDGIIIHHTGTGKANPNTMTIPHGSIQNVKLKSCYPFEYFITAINCPTKFGIMFSVVSEDGTKYESTYEMGSVDFLHELVPHFQSMRYLIFNLLESGESPEPITMSFESDSISDLHELAKKMKN